MNVKLNWLKELVDLEGLSLDEIVNKLSLYSTEVEGVKNVVSGSKLVIGKVLECVDHPDSDHLHVCKVDVGSEVLQIVCGAPNVKEGLYVIVALIDCVLPGDFKIKKSKIRGVESFGMLCSLKELGLENKFVPEKYAAGIYYFEDEVEIGKNALECLELEDEVIELGLTPNRGDLLSMLGVAYEISAVFDRPLKPLTYELIEGELEDEVEVDIDTEDCLVYHARVFKDIEIKESPQWLKSRLIAFGTRPINNVVDITNYILALFGQPLHAFDYDKLGNKILVRKACDKEQITTLDNQERILEENDIVITDGTKPVAIAGVMGGLDTEITSETKNMVLEVAVFDSVKIRLTSSRLGLRSESSNRYEKGVDTNRCKLALDYATYLFKTLANAKVSKNITTTGKAKEAYKEVKVTKDYISSSLGIELSKEEIISVLNRLNFEVKVNEEELTVLVPSRRMDISIPADIVEEVGRIYGYEKLPLTLPKDGKSGTLTNYQKRRKELKHTLINMGLNEIITYSLVSEKENNEFKILHEANSEAIKLMYPISGERSELRQSLIPSALEYVGYCYNRKIKDIASYEVGKVYYQKDNDFCEEEVLSVVMANNFSSLLWRGNLEKVDYYLIKGILDAALKNLDIKLEYRPLEKECQEMHPLRTAQIYYENELVGYIGAIHPKYAQINDLKDVYVAEVKLSKILNKELETTIYKPISKVPSVERDIALVMKKDINASDIVNTILSVDKKTLSDVKIFDLYVGDKVKEDEKSLAIKLVFTSYETLTDELVNSKVNKILKELEKKYQAVLRA